MSSDERPAVSGPVYALSTWDMFLFGYHPKEGDLIVDLGAGVGVDTRLFSDLVRPDGRVVSVEPDPWLFRCLRWTISQHGLDNVTAVRSTVLGAAAEGAVAGERLGELVERLEVDRIDLLKVNIGGGELGVLAAAPAVLARVRNIVVSCHDFRADEGGSTWLRTSAAVGDLLCEAGFTVMQRPADPRPRIYYCVYGTR
ncbi:hypothetical protein [Actinophytocola sp.]|uniref:hypothetical protein n=1 Tax=Actinophytocola sp. TaxID=1872138 RepID=UPI002ED0859B